jgi:hypothetical protein
MLVYFKCETKNAECLLLGLSDKVNGFKTMLAWFLIVEDGWEGQHTLEDRHVTGTVYEVTEKHENDSLQGYSTL